MSDRSPITEAGLRAAVRDPRDRTRGHPERAGYVDGVTDGFRAMSGSGEAKAGVVHVRAYTRRRDGKLETVGAHTRGAPPGGLAVPVMAPAAAALAGPAVLRVAPLVAGGIEALRRGLPAPGGMPWVSRRSLLEPPGVWNEAHEDGGESAPESPAEAPRPRHPVNSQQAKHTWPPDREFVPGRDVMPDGRSAIRPEESAQGLADEFAGTGERRGHREYVDTGRVIGTWRDRDTNEVSETTHITIHHQKNGSVHIVPAAPTHVRERRAR